MELIQLSDIFKNGEFKFLKYDYLYLHHKSEYPLRNEMNFDHYYYVTEVFKDKLTVRCVISSPEEKDMEDKELYFKDLNDKWWFTRLPDSFLSTEIV